jgi:xanthine dehydrogenase YagR molybdenum-binding subunit
MMAQAPQQIGSPVSRVEGRDKVTGRALYTADTTVASMTYAALVQLEIAHGVVTAESLRVGAERAAGERGVLYVLTPLNCPALHVLPRDLTDILPLERRPPLSDLTVQHVGQHMALVVADSQENATYAASLFDLRYETRWR